MNNAKCWWRCGISENPHTNVKWYSLFRKQLEISNEVKYTLTIWPRNEYLGIHTRGFPGGSVVKNPPASAGDVGLILWLGRCPGEGNGNLLQYSCLGNPMDRGAWWATVRGVTKESDTTEWLNNNNKFTLEKWKQTSTQNPIPLMLWLYHHHQKQLICSPTCEGMAIEQLLNE